MASEIKKFAEDIEGTRLFIEEAKIVVITKRGKREEFFSDGEIIGKEGFVGHDSIDFKQNRANKSLSVFDIKSVNGIPVSRYEVK